MLPRAAAVQGIGYGPAQTAAQGLRGTVDCVLLPAAIAMAGVGYGPRSMSLDGFSCGAVPGPQPSFAPGFVSAAHRRYRQDEPAATPRRRRNTDADELLFLFRR